MKKLFYYAVSFIITGIPTLQALAQPAFNTKEFIDINNIKAAALVHGDLWWDPAITYPLCEFPKGSGKNIMSASSIWMAGYDNNNVLHVSAQTYRQTGSDYWPGPLDGNDSVTYATSTNWAKIWKINRTDIMGFQAISTHTVMNTPAAILEWPAKNNPYAAGAGSVALTITTDMAPFVDVNSDGNYNPLDGDYPDMKGDQMLWWVFSDNGSSHNNAFNGGHPLKAEVHAKAYAFKKNTLVDNVVYYEMKVTNKSASNYSGFRFGIWADADLGNSQDDYVGFDATHRMGIVYNGKSTDAIYGSQIPVAGVTFLKMPGDNMPSYQPAGSFMTYNNDNSPLGNPEKDSNYNNYLRSLWLNGAHLKNTFKGPGIASTGYGSGNDVNYIFPGDPSKSNEWSECISGNFPGDRRFIVATNDYNFASNTSTTVAFALVVTQPGNTGCPNTSFTDIKAVADTAWVNYGYPVPTAVNNMAANENTDLKLYPNPVHDKLFINTELKDLQVYDALGRRMTLPVKQYNGKTELNVSVLPAGLYHMVTPANTGNISQTFIKE
jgi:hypothetical protein